MVKLLMMKVICHTALRGKVCFAFVLSCIRVNEQTTEPVHPTFQVYYRYATTEEIKEMVLWAYPVKEEKKVEVKTLSEEQRAEIKSIFVLYDLNNNGTLSKGELTEALSATGYDDDEIEEMFEDFDSDGDNEIDFEEFCKMLESSYIE